MTSMPRNLAHRRRYWGNQSWHRRSSDRPSRHLTSKINLSSLERPHKLVDLQKVKLMMMLFASKCEPMLQFVFGKNAVGVPYLNCINVGRRADEHEALHTQLSVLMVEAPISLGLLPLRGKNQTFMKLLVRSMAYQPPPIAFNEGP